MTLRRKLGDPPVIHTVPEGRLPASAARRDLDRPARMLLVGAAGLLAGPFVLPALVKSRCGGIRPGPGGQQVCELPGAGR